MESAGKVVLRFLCGLQDESAPTRTFGIQAVRAQATVPINIKRRTPNTRTCAMMNAIEMNCAWWGPTFNSGEGLRDRGYGVLVKKRGSTRSTEELVLDRGR